MFHSEGLTIVIFTDVLVICFVSVAYKPRALPSAGLFVFMQSFICDFRNSEVDPSKPYLTGGLPDITNSRSVVICEFRVISKVMFTQVNRNGII